MSTKWLNCIHLKWKEFNSTTSKECRFFFWEGVFVKVLVNGTTLKDCRTCLYMTYVRHLIALEMCGKVPPFSAVLRSTWKAFKFRELYHILKISARLSIFLNESLHFSLIRLQKVYTLAILMKQKLWAWKYSKSITERSPQLVLRTECH